MEASTGTLTALPHLSQQTVVQPGFGADMSSVQCIQGGSESQNFACNFKTHLELTDIIETYCA